MNRYSYLHRFWLATALLIGLVGAQGCESKVTGALASGPSHWASVLKTEPSFKVRLQAALLLGRSANPEALGPLIDCAQNDENASVRRAAIDGLAILKRPRAIVPLLKMASSDPDPMIAAGAKIALDNFDLVGHQEFVLAAFDSDDVRVRSSVLRSLPLPLAEVTKPVIFKSFGDYPEVYQQALKLLVTMPRARRIEWIKEALVANETAIRAGAVRALGRDDHPETAQLVIQIFEQDDQALEVKEAAAHSLRELKKHLVAGDFIRDATSHADAHMRMRAIRVLEAMGGRDASRALVIALSDQEAPVRGRAAMALGSLGVIAVLPKLEEMADDPLNQSIKLHLTRAAQSLRSAMVTDQ